MGKWIGAIRLARSSLKSNPRNTFEHGRKSLKPLFICVLVGIVALYLLDYLTNFDIIQTLVYTAAIFGFRYRTIIQFAPLIDQFSPGVARLIGLGAIIKIVLVIGAIRTGVSWVRTQ